MVAAEVKHIAEAEYERERGAEEKRESRRDRLRAAYRIQHKPVGRKVNREAIFFLVGNVASVTFAAWRGLFALDMVALAEAGTHGDPCARRAERNQEPPRARPPHRVETIPA